MVVTFNQRSISFHWAGLFRFIAIFLLSGQALAAANITARLDRNPVSLDESFHLVYEADSNVDEPDFSVLDRDFEILSSSQSTNMRSINGNWNLKKSWDLTLISKQAGVFTIPPVPFGNDTSPSVLVTVKPASQSPGVAKNASGEPSQLFLEVETDNKQAWVQSQIIYTVRLLRTTSISSASLSEPETSDPDAIIERLGDDASYDTTRNGVRYAVIERKYTIYPQHSGKLTINPLRFEGNVATPNVRPRSFMDQFMSLNTGSRQRIMSKRVDVDVKPAPAGTSMQNWLPAKKLILSETWSDDVTQLKTGEPVTRTLILQADGLMAEQLPDIKPDEIDGLKQYPDKAQLENTPGNDGFRGTRQIKIAMIPTRAGDYKLPAIEIPWFNTVTGKPELARLPGVELHSIGAASASAALPTAAMPVVPQPNPATSTATPITQPQPVDEHAAVNGVIWRWISLALAIGWIATTLLLLRSRHRTPSENRVQRSRPVPLQPLKKAVTAACASGDAHRTKNALLDWARARWPDEAVTSLSDIVALTGEPLAREIHKLNDALYSREADWSPDALRSAIDGLPAKSGPHRQDEAPVLEPLYRT